MKRKQKPLGLRAALRHVAEWNNADIRGFDDISPDLRMLRARKRFLSRVLKRRA